MTEISYTPQGQSDEWFAEMAEVRPTGVLMVPDYVPADHDEHGGIAFTISNWHWEQVYYDDGCWERRATT